tara:strand:- start:586 stop:1050 length:465 start_codon:yes stop_codon:yes gene_type:complete
MENYLYFRTEATIANDDDIATSAMFPASSFLGCYPVSDTSLKLHFKPLFFQNTAATRVVQQSSAFDQTSIMVKQPHDLLTDTVELTINTNKHKEVMEALAIQIVKGPGSSSGFITVADDLSGATEYLNKEITACGTITINVAASGSDSFSSTFA